MTRTFLFLVAGLLIVGGTTAVTVAAQAAPVGGPEPGSAATYRVLVDDEHYANFTIVRTDDVEALAPDGSLRPGAFYAAEWTAEGMVIASEELHVAEDGIWRHAMSPLRAVASVFVDGQPHEAVLEQFEETRFDGKSALCGAILPVPVRPARTLELPGCEAPFDVLASDGWTLTGNGRTIHFDPGDAWPARLVVQGQTPIVYERHISGTSHVTAPAFNPVDTPTPSPLAWTGPDDGDIVSWPLADAIAAAEEDPLYADLRAYLADHPDAVVVEAGFRPMVADGQDQEIWQIVLSDGLTAFAMEAVRATERAPQGLEVLSPFFGQIVTTEFDTQQAPDARYPDADTRPDHMPTAADAARTWQAIRGHGQAPTAYHFTMACTETCGDARLTVGAVEYAENRPDRVVVCSNCVLSDLEASDVLTVAASGELVSLEKRQSMFQEPGSFSTSPSDAFGFSEARIIVAPAGSIALLAGLATLVALLWKSAPVAAFFSRVHGDQALESPERQRILQIVQSTPGVHHNEIVRVTGKGNGSVEHHLRTLVRTGHLSQKRAGGFVCYYAKGALDRRVMAALPVLKADLAKDILGAVQKDPGLTGADLARLTGAENSTIAYHLKRLEGAGLIERRRAGRVVQAYPQELAGKALRFAA